MKINGRKVEGPNIETLVLPRSDGDLVIRAQAVLSYENFEKVCPLPEPPIMLQKGGAKVPDFDEPFYKGKIAAWSAKKTQWMILESLKATPGIEWDTVIYTEPDTWNNWENELKTAGFSDVERQRIFNIIIDANCLNEKKMEVARERFLLEEKSQLDMLTSRKEDQVSTPSSELANVSA